MIDDDEVLMHAGRPIDYGQRQRAAPAIIALIYPILSYRKIYIYILFLPRLQNPEMRSKLMNDESEAVHVHTIQYIELTRKVRTL